MKPELPALVELIKLGFISKVIELKDGMQMRKERSNRQVIVKCLILLGENRYAAISNDEHFKNSDLVWVFG